MRKRTIICAFAFIAGIISAYSQTGNTTQDEGIWIKKQGVFSSGGRVTAPNPGYNNGEPANVWYTLPVTFRLGK